MINFYFKNNTTIKILAIEIFDLITSFSMIKFLLKNLGCALIILAPFSVCRELIKLKNCGLGLTI
jgi:hypothetical protein